MLFKLNLIFKHLTSYFFPFISLDVVFPREDAVLIILTNLRIHYIEGYNFQVTDLYKHQFQRLQIYKRTFVKRFTNFLKKLQVQSLKFEKTSNALPKPAEPGEFAKMILDYKKKIARDASESSVAPTEFIDVPNLFAENSIPGTPLLDEVR